MAGPTVSEVIEGRLISGDAVIVPTVDEPVRAVDVLGRFAAVFRFSVDHDGSWFEECTLALLAEDGKWRGANSGGSRGDGWEVPWRPSMAKMGGRAVWVCGSFGMTLEDDQEQPVFVRGVYGFCDPAVRALRVGCAGSDRAVQVTSVVGAFVVVVTGEAPAALQARDESGGNLGPAVTIGTVGSEPRKWFQRRGSRTRAWRWDRS